MLMRVGSFVVVSGEGQGCCCELDGLRGCTNNAKGSGPLFALSFLFRRDSTSSFPSRALTCQSMSVNLDVSTLRNPES